MLKAPVRSVHLPVRSSRRSWTAALAVSLVALLSGCGRVGVEQLPDPDQLDAVLADAGAVVEDADSEPGSGDAGSASDGDVSTEGDANDDAEVADTGVADTGPACGDGSGDTTCDGLDDDCDGVFDEDYVSSATSCGVGSCLRSGVLSCVAGSPSDSCVPGAPAPTDANCNNLDEDCSGTADDDYVPPVTSCGIGGCIRAGVTTCTAGATADTCVPGTPAASDGPAMNGIDDDCDGTLDEDACVSTAANYSAGTHTSFTVPQFCGSVTVQMWGGGGGSGNETSVGGTGTPGRGGAGGYVQHTATLSGPVTLYVGAGGTGCGAGGTIPDAGISNYNGGAGGTGGPPIPGPGPSDGVDGQDITAGSGGAGAVGTGMNFAGGDGRWGGGGGGGGAGSSTPPYPGGGGGGGAASVLLVGGVRQAVAGGGGGGGGAGLGTTGGTGGGGCSRPGTSLTGGGGGGGGQCLGTVQMPGGDAGVPAPPSSGTLPPGSAVGASGLCGNGGNGHAIVRFSP